jgi:hypothetical protein
MSVCFPREGRYRQAAPAAVIEAVTDIALWRPDKYGSALDLTVSATLRCYKRRMNRLCNGLLGLAVLLWAVTAGERQYARYHAAQAVKTMCAHEPARFFSKYQYSDCLRRSTARASRRATA